MLNTYIFTLSGVAVIDGMVSAERAAYWSASGQGVAFLQDNANHLAPGIGYALDLDQLRSIGNDVANSEMSDALKASFSIALGTMVGIATSPTGPAISLMAGTFASTIFEKAYDQASNLSKQADRTPLYDKLDEIKNEWSGNTDPLNLLTTTSAQMVINQYSTGEGEFVSVKFIDKYGVAREEVGKLSGVAAEERWLPEQTIRVKISGSGEVTVTPDDLIRTIDLSTATLVHSSSITLTETDFQNALNYTTTSLQNSYAGNTVDYANSIAVAAGLSEYGVGQVDYSLYANFTVDPGLRTDGLTAHLDPSTKAGQYALGTSYILGSQWATQWDDNNADWTLQEIRAAIERVGNSIKLKEIADFNAVWSEAGGTPIALDLNGDGLHTTSLASSKINFDITGDGVADRTAWLSPEDAFLTLDRNGNGLVDGINELFGGEARGAGYARLAELDSNGDHVITAADNKFGTLQLWQDKNSDGKTDAGEMLSLQKLGITALGLDFTSQEVRQQGNLIGETSQATRNGQDMAMADVYFRFTSVEEAERGLYRGRPMGVPTSRTTSTTIATEETNQSVSIGSEILPAPISLYMDPFASNYLSLTTFQV
ncbi:MAG: hypothetical protein EOO28_08765 [Comamonadaceae bacterium]|nr:MAG: hypothetical protein EOO28_08765 [Comamonadaceae bacterium]